MLYIHVILGWCYGYGFSTMLETGSGQLLFVETISCNYYIKQRVFLSSPDPRLLWTKEQFWTFFAISFFVFGLQFSFVT